MKVRRLAAASKVAAIYGGSILALFLAEVILARRLEPEAFGRYALVRNAVPLVVLLSMFGSEQAITREYAAARRLGAARRVAAAGFRNAWVIGGAIAILGLWVLGSGTYVAVSVILICPAVVISEVSAAVLRSRGLYGASALTQQGYRLLFGISVITMLMVDGVSLNRALTAFVLGSVIVAVTSWFRSGLVRDIGASDNDHRAIRRLGVGFGLSMVSLAFLDWADQVFVTLLGAGLADTGYYAAHKLIAVYPMISISSILGFILMPELARLGRGAVLRRPRWYAIGAAGVVCAYLLWVPAAQMLIGRITGRDPGTALTALLGAVGIGRLVYVLPSSILGAFGSTRLIWWTSVAGMGSIVILPAASMAASSLGAGASESVAVGLIGATALRLAVALTGALLVTRPGVAE